MWPSHMHSEEGLAPPQRDPHPGQSLQRPWASAEGGYKGPLHLSPLTTLHPGSSGWMRTMCKEMSIMTNMCDKWNGNAISPPPTTRHGLACYVLIMWCNGHKDITVPVRDIRESHLYPPRTSKGTCEWTSALGEWVSQWVSKNINQLLFSKS